MKCPHCHQSVSLLSPALLIAKPGKPIRCPHCGQPVVISRKKSTAATATMVIGVIVASVFLVSKVSVFIMAPVLALFVFTSLVLGSELTKPTD